MATELTTVARMKNYMRPDGTWTAAETTLLGTIAGAINEAIEDYCGRIFLKDPALEEIHDGNVTRLFLKRPPIDSVTAVYQDVARAFAATTALDSTAYQYDPNTGILTKSTGRFIGGKRVVRVDYSGGYAAGAIPSSVKMAADIWAVGIANKAMEGADGLLTERLGDITQQFDQAEMPPFVEQRLNKYRKSPWVKP